LIILIIYGERYRLSSSLLYSFLSPPIISSLLGPNILLSALFSDPLYYNSGYYKELAFLCSKLHCNFNIIFLLLRNNVTWMHLVTMVTTENTLFVLIPVIFMRRNWWRKKFAWIRTQARSNKANNFSWVVCPRKTSFIILFLIMLCLLETEQGKQSFMFVYRDVSYVFIISFCKLAPQKVTFCCPKTQLISHA
jgi:hypothetical protein